MVAFSTTGGVLPMPNFIEVAVFPPTSTRIWQFSLSYLGTLHWTLPDAGRPSPMGDGSFFPSTTSSTCAWPLTCRDDQLTSTVAPPLPSGRTADVIVTLPADGAGPVSSIGFVAPPTLIEKSWLD